VVHLLGGNPPAPLGHELLGWGSDEGSSTFFTRIINHRHRYSAVNTQFD
jgi:hypothetical protein